ncbi:MAG: EpsG family protein [Mediterranea sp.]|nr:EpsG family protein [Mediterranea sp.]
MDFVIFFTVIVCCTFIFCYYISTIYRKEHIRDIRSTHENNIYLTFVFILVGLLVTLRSVVVGNDTETYVELFERIADLQYGDVLDYLRYEIGYLYLNKFVSHISTHPQTILIVTGIITTASYYLFIKKYSKSVYLSVFMFILLRYMDQTMNIIRECIALSILFYAYNFIEQKKLVPFILSVLFASLFHKTAIIFLAAWLIVKIPFNIKNLILLTIGVIILFINFEILFETSLSLSLFQIYAYYEDGKYFGDTRIATILQTSMILSFFVLALYIRKNIGVKTYKNLGYEKMLMLLYVGMCIMVLSFKFNLFDRIATYFNVFSIIIIPNTVALIKRFQVRLFIQLAIISLLSIYYIIIITYRPEWNRIYPYYFF